MIVFLVNGVLIIDYKNIIDDEINTDYLSDHTMNTWQSDRTAEVRKEINRLGGKTVEIKSTRLAQKYKDRVEFTGYNSAKKIEELIESLMGLDFLTYPFFSRYGDMTFDQYCWYAEAKHLHTYL